MKKVNLFGLDICDADYSELIEYVYSAVLNKKNVCIITANAAMVVEALNDKQIFSVFSGADLITPDGMSVVLASRFLDTPIRKRITGFDSLLLICQKAQIEGFKLFFLGASREVIEKSTAVLLDRFPQLEVAGYHDGYFHDDDAVIDLINKSGASVLFVGMGSPKQEYWMSRNRTKLKVPVIIGVGGSFDVISGCLRRAPLWMQRIGLEWLFRLLQEPKRLWKRYLVTNTVFIYEVLKQKFFSK